MLQKLSRLVIIATIVILADTIKIQFGVGGFIRIQKMDAPQLNIHSNQYSKNLQE